MSTTPLKIIIPPKNIFEINNQIVKSNVINRVEVKSYEITPKNDYDTVIFEENVELISKKYENWIYNEELYSFQDITGYLTERQYAFIAFQPKYEEISVTIPKLKNNIYINEVFHSYKIDEITHEKEDDIKFTIHSIKKTGTTYADYIDKEITPNDVHIPAENVKSEQVVETLNPKLEYSYTHIIAGSVANRTVTASINFDNTSNVDNPSYWFDENNYYLTIKFFVGYKRLTLGGYDLYSTPRNFRVEGEYEEFLPQQLDITIYGNTISINLNDVTKIVGDNNSTNLFSIERNELLQTTNTYNGLNAIENNYANVINAYKNGKETATLLCSVDNYYDKDGNEVISIKNDKPMLFKRHDIVIPYIGKDKPMSTYSDGTPKSFMVLKSHIYSKGVVWQELTIQEI